MQISVLLQYMFGGRKAIEDEIAEARRIAMRRAGRRCEISGKSGKLHGHHLWDVSTYPWWAASPWNIIILTESLHGRFHSWNGGTAKPCTVFGFWLWRYFNLQWWKGWGVILLLFYAYFSI